MFACGDGEEEMVLVANEMEKETGKRVGEGDCDGLRGVMEKQIWKEI